MNAITHYHTELLLAALKRFGAPMRSDDLLDYAVGLSLENSATPAHTSGLNVRSVAAHLLGMVRSGRVLRTTSTYDSRHTREIPLWQPTSGFDLRAEIPAPPALTGKPLGAMRPKQRGREAGRLLAERLASHQPATSALDRLFRGFSEEAAGLLLRMQTDIGDLVKKYEPLYADALRERGDE